MTQLLISVKNVEETLIALEAGVDIIDLKDPENGALGALDIATSKSILQVISGAAIVYNKRFTNIYTKMQSTPITIWICWFAKITRYREFDKV